MPGASRSFKTRYLSGDLEDFFDLHPGDLSSAMERDLERPRGELASALLEEADRLGAPQQARAAIGRLASPNSRAVVTGQQAGLLLGPAYTLSKAMSAISLARELDSEESPVVAVFWVASQDHDTAEIDNAALLDGQETLRRVAVPLPEQMPAGAIEFRREWLAEVVAAMTATGARPELLQECRELLTRAADAAGSYADLFASLLWRLLGDQGLIVLDPSRPRIAELFRPVLERELADPTVTIRAIEEAGSALERMGARPQLGRGKSATNLFLTEGSADEARRTLVRFDGGRFSTDSRAYTRDELSAILCSEPWRLTPAAGLRPVTQDAVLPTVAFVVGPGELGYLAQLRGVYRHHGVPMPLAWPRATSVVLEPPVRRILDRFGADYWRFARERGELVERLLLERSGHAVAFDEALSDLGASVGRLLEHVEAIDPTLVGPVEKGRRRLAFTVDGLRHKTGEAVLRGDEVMRRQHRRLEAHLFPGGTPQERVISPFSFFLKFGVEPMMRLYRTVGTSGEYLLEP